MIIDFLKQRRRREGKRAEADLETLMEDQQIRADQERLAAAIELARKLGINVSGE